MHEPPRKTWHFALIVFGTGRIYGQIEKGVGFEMTIVSSQKSEHIRDNDDDDRFTSAKDLQWTDATADVGNGMGESRSMSAVNSLAQAVQAVQL